jgi:hypothetical protein
MKTPARQVDLVRIKSGFIYTTKTKADVSTLRTIYTQILGSVSRFHVHYILERQLSFGPRIKLYKCRRERSEAPSHKKAMDEEGRIL